MRPGDGALLIWPSGSVLEKWLEVIVKATANTGLAANDVFFFGSAVAKSGGGDMATLSETTLVDELGARNNGKTLLNNIANTNLFDYNRDGLLKPAVYINLASPPKQPTFSACRGSSAVQPT